ncbi:MAG TPA: Wzz/FepE/Etk N-terminal domain-containing protein [Streptosporangiales bacterium]
MSTQELDLRRAWGILRRLRWLVLAIAGVGLLGGVGIGWLFPAMPTADALVVLPPPAVNQNGTPVQDIQTQVFIANSAAVLTSAGQNVKPVVRLTDVKSRVHVTALTQEILQIRAQGRSAEQAEDLANSVAATYVFYVTDSDTQLPGDLGKKVGARVLERATTARGGNMYLHLGLYGAIGAVGAGILGSLVLLAVMRGDRRLRLRDDIAGAVGIPVLASVATQRPGGASGWARLLEHYRPSAVDAWSLRKMLRDLGLDARTGRPASLTVVTLTEDVRALAVGPQLAAFATAIGIPAEVTVDTMHESVSALIAGLRGPSAEDGPRDAEQTEAFRVFVVVADRDAPNLDGTQRSDATVVAVSAGRATAEELARVAVAVTNDRRAVDGIVVADPDEFDRTTGRAPHTGRSAVTRARAALTDTTRGTGHT